MGRDIPIGVFLFLGVARKYYKSALDQEEKKG